MQVHFIQRKQFNEANKASHFKELQVWRLPLRATENVLAGH